MPEIEEVKYVTPHSEKYTLMVKVSDYNDGDEVNLEDYNVQEVHYVSAFDNDAGSSEHLYTEVSDKTKVSVKNGDVALSEAEVTFLVVADVYQSYSI